jgi:sugar (pentulose or hexulose) kinase
MSAVAVFDVGKTNVKLSAATVDGTILETLSAQNTVREGPPYRHHDLAAIEEWLIGGLNELGRRHMIRAIVPCAHGSGGVLVGRDGPAMPMVDYEQPVPADVNEAYRVLVGSYRDRGSAVMLGAAHLARQMLWQEMYWPEVFSRAIAFLATPQYWAWRLSGHLAGEVTSLAAQSHLWAPADGRPAGIVARRGWQRLMPPMRHAWETLGPIQPELAARAGLALSTRVVCGIHDSSANFYRYQAAGLSDLTLVSTGTWIVALTDREEVDHDLERPGHACNADIAGRPGSSPRSPPARAGWHRPKSSIGW